MAPAGRPESLLLAGRVITPEQDLPQASVLIRDGRVAWIRKGRVAVGRTRRLSRPGDTIVPGFIDLQVNGLAGHDAAHGADAIRAIARALPAWGVTAFLPTLISRPLGEAVQFVERVATASTGGHPLPAAGPGAMGGPPEPAAPRMTADPRAPGARIMGAHLEGPFLSPEYRGAHDAAYLLPPDPAAVRTILKRPPRLLTLAPELPGALAAIRALAQAGVVVAAGHSGATFAEGQAGIAAGVRFATHLFNAMAPWHHRDPGIVGALLRDSRVTLGVIADGIHLHDGTLELLFRVRGAGGIALTTDQTAAAAAPPGRYLLGHTVVSSDGHAVRRSDGTIAGSAATMDACLRRAAALPGCDLRAAVAMATRTPARAMGWDRRIGHIRRGYPADLVILDRRLRVRVTLLAGEVAFRAR